jgi:hypothetical protein
MGWTILESNPGDGEIFRTSQDLVLSTPSGLYIHVSFPAVKRPGSGTEHPSAFIFEVKERVELYIYFPLGLHDLF